MTAQRQNLRDLLACGDLTPPRSDSSEPSMSPVSAPLSPVSPSTVKEESDASMQSVNMEQSLKTGLQDHSRLTLSAFLFMFLAFNPLGIIVNNMPSVNTDYFNQPEGRTLLYYKGTFVIICYYYYD